MHLQPDQYIETFSKNQNNKLSQMINNNPHNFDSKTLKVEK